MKRAFLIIVIATAIFAAGGCKASKQSAGNRSIEERERLNSDQRRFRRIFDQETNR